MKNPRLCKIRGCQSWARGLGRCWRHYLHLPKQVAYFKEYRRKHRIRMLEHNKAARKQKYALLTRLRRVPCLDCKTRFPFYVMEFDHARGQKSHKVCEMTGRSVAAIMEEVSKCDVVCANCHRVRTYKRRTGKCRTKPQK